MRRRAALSVIYVCDSFTRESRAVAVNYSDSALRANLAAILTQYRAAGFSTRPTGGMFYRAISPAGYHVNIWYARPNTAPVIRGGIK